MRPTLLAVSLHAGPLPRAGVAAATGHTPLVAGGHPSHWSPVSSSPQVRDPFLQGLAGELGNGLAFSGGDGSGARTQGCGDPERNLRRGSRARRGRSLPTRRTVTFGLDGTTYDIDLSATDAAALGDDLATWVSQARRTSGSTATSRTRRPASATTPGSGHTTMIRRWARANGYNVSDRGRLPIAVRQAYNAAH
jgi:hypothetical protein